MSPDCFFALPCGAMGFSAAGGCVFPNHTHLLFDIFIYIITFRCHILIKRIMLSSVEMLHSYPEINIFYIEISYMLNSDLTFLHKDV